MFHRKPLLLAITAILFLTSCGPQAPTASPTPAVYVPEGTPGVKPRVEILLPDPIPCHKVTDANCKYNYRIKMRETNGASVHISKICETYTDTNNKVWSEGGLDGCFTVNLVIPPGGTVEYDHDLWVMGETFLGGKLNIKITTHFKDAQNAYYGSEAKTVQLAWPSWSTLTPKMTSTSPIPTKKP